MKPPHDKYQLEMLLHKKRERERLLYPESQEQRKRRVTQSTENNVMQDKRVKVILSLVMMMMMMMMKPLLRSSPKLHLRNCISSSLALLFPLFFSYLSNSIACIDGQRQFHDISSLLIKPCRVPSSS